jgi:hypothetical protein
MLLFLSTLLDVQNAAKCRVPAHSIVKAFVRHVLASVLYRALDAIFPLNRVDDFLLGESARGKHVFSISKTRRNKQGSLKRPEISYLESTSYHCEFGPQDLTLNSAEYEAFFAKRADTGMVL